MRSRLCRKRRQLRPIDWLEQGRYWPSGPFRADAPPLVRYSAAFAENLAAALTNSRRRTADPDVREALERVHRLGDGSAMAVLVGEQAVTIELVDALEALFDARLWPTREQVRRLR